MTSQILKYVDFTKIQKSRYLKNEILFFLQINKFINYTSRGTLWQKNSFVAEITFKDIRIKNLNRINLAHLNINSLRNKLDLLANQIKGNVNLLAISETKLDDSFPAGQFKIPGHASPFILDRNQNGGGILVFVRENIPVTFLSSEEKPIEAFFFELNFHKKKWLVCCSYNPNKSNISKHLNILRKSLDFYSAHYESTILIGDFNVSIDDPHMESFCESYRFKSL